MDRFTELLSMVILAILANTVDAQWTKVGKLQETYIFPIKSAKGQTVKEINVEELALRSGLLYDRGLMITTDDSQDSQLRNMITGRDFISFATNGPHPVAVIETSVVGGTITSARLKLKAPGRQNLEIPFSSCQNGHRVRVTMKYTDQVKSQLDALDCGQLVSDWLTDHLSQFTTDKRYYLIYAPGDRYGESMLFNGRQLKDYPKWQASGDKRALFEGREETALFQDLTGFSLATIPSLRTHQQQTGRPDSMMRFRPNFVVEGTFQAFDEDNWHMIKIGKVVFERVKGISRCVMVNIDENGNVDRGNTCLNSLMRYRKVTAGNDLESQHNAGTAIFGAHLVYAGVEENGVVKNMWKSGLKVKKGDSVYVQYKAGTSSKK